MVEIGFHFSNKGRVFPQIAVVTKHKILIKLMLEKQVSIIFILRYKSNYPFFLNKYARYAPNTQFSDISYSNCAFVVHHFSKYSSE